MFEYTNPTPKQIKEIIASGRKPMMFYHIPKKEIISKDLTNVGKVINTAKSVGKGCRQTIILTVDGYDDVVDELFEIQEVRDYMDKLFNKYPYLLYYLSDFQDASTWVLSAIADKVVTIYSSEKMTSNELFEKYGLEGHDKIPKLTSNLTFSNFKLNKLLTSVIGQGNVNGDRAEAKKIAIELGVRFDKSGIVLQGIGITQSDLRDYLEGK